MKMMTFREAETKWQRAVEFLRRIGNHDAADQFAAMDARQYAEDKGADLIANPQRRDEPMPRSKSKAELQAELDESRDYIEDLEAKLDDIAGLASGEDEDEDDEEEDADSEEDELE
jgi:hypothetical protein